MRKQKRLLSAKPYAILSGVYRQTHYGIRVSTNERVSNERNERVKTVFEGLDRVPNHLSQVKGRCRVKHIDSCIDCNNDYVVTTHNQIRCPECSEKTRAKFVKDAVKRNG